MKMYKLSPVMERKRTKIPYSQIHSACDLLMIFTLLNKRVSFNKTLENIEYCNIHLHAESSCNIYTCLPLLLIRYLLVYILYVPIYQVLTCILFLIISLNI